MSRFALPAEALASLELVRPAIVRRRRHDDPVKLARRRRRLALFHATLREGLRHSRNTPVYCT